MAKRTIKRDEQTETAGSVPEQPPVEVDASPKDDPKRSATVKLTPPSAFGLRVLNDRIIYNNGSRMNIVMVPPGSAIAVRISW